MRNKAPVPGNLLPLLFVCGLAAQAPPRDPLDAAILAATEARNAGRFEDIAASREQARALLQRLPVNSPSFGNWVHNVSRLYQSGGLNSQARSVLLEALARIAPLGDSHPARIAILNSLAESFKYDGNLLRAVGYLEQALAAQAVARPVVEQGVSMMFYSRAGRFNPYIMPIAQGRFQSTANAYNGLAELYQQLGQPDAVAGVILKVRTLAAGDPATLARFFEQRGQLDEAAVSYRALAVKSPDPQEKAAAWQTLANLYARQQKFDDAIVAGREAIAAVQASGHAGAPDQSLRLRQSLAGFLQQADRADQAGELYLRNLQQSSGGPFEGEMLGNYAEFLGANNQTAEAESLWKRFLDGRSNLYPEEKARALRGLAHLAEKAGDAKRVEEYTQSRLALFPPLPSQSPFPPGEVRISDELNQAQAAAEQRRFDDAERLTLHAIDIAPQAADNRELEWRLPSIASALSAGKQRSRAKYIHRRLLQLAQSWSADSLQRLITARHNYLRFLLDQPEPGSEVPAAIASYRDLLIEANGPDSGTLAEPLRKQIEWERGQSQWQKMDSSIRQLLALQESLSGNTSEPYFSDLQLSAQAYSASGDRTAALELLRKTIPIADLLATPDNDWRRAETRMRAAFELASLHRFDEAEALAEEAIARQSPVRSPQPLKEQLAQIRAIRR